MSLPSPHPDWPPPVEICNAEGRSSFVLTCEHASNHMPAEYAGLGLSEAERERHIAWDIGAARVTRVLSRLLDAPAFLSGYSRLLIDLNRPPGAASSIPVLSEETRIDANARLPDAERLRRLDTMFLPFHAAVAHYLDKRRDAGRTAVIAAIHSFTPVFKGRERPWCAGVLFSHSKVYGEALVEALARETGLPVAANEPYVIDRAEDYTVPVHGEDRGLPAVLVEIRQDLLASDADCVRWAGWLAAALSSLTPGKW